MTITPYIARERTAAAEWKCSKWHISSHEQGLRSSLFSSWAVQTQLCFESKQHRRQAENGKSCCEVVSPQTIPASLYSSVMFWLSLQSVSSSSTSPSKTWSQQFHKHFMPCVSNNHHKQEKPGLWVHGSVQSPQKIIIGFVSKHLAQGTE